MKLRNPENDSNKKRGIRLRECREYRKITQETFAEMVDKTPNYISMLERGERQIDWNKAVEFAEVLEVSPSFIMCETDIMIKGKKRETLDFDVFGEMDLLFVRFLVADGHNIVFHVINLYDGQEPPERQLHETTYYDWRALYIDASIDDLREFCLSDAHCKLQQNETLSEVIIIEVTVDGYKMTYGRFVYMVNRLYDFIRFSVDNSKNDNEDTVQQDINDKLIADELQRSRFMKNGKAIEVETLSEYHERINNNVPERDIALKKALQQIEEIYGKGSIISVKKPDDNK